MKDPSPADAADAVRVAREVLGERIVSAERFTTGAGNRVFDVSSENGRRAVVRFMRCGAELQSGIYWSRTLRPLGVPLPEMLAFQCEPDEQHPGWMVLERFPGVDLEHAYAALTTAQKLAVLDGVLRAQRTVHSLPHGSAFGYVNMRDEARHSMWSSVIVEQLEKSRRRISDVDIVDPRQVDRVESLLPRFEDYFITIRPVPFLDDTTTRNVIVDDGALRGIVDVDGICFGDPLLVPSLTRMALLNMRCDTIYTDTWLERAGATVEQRRAVDFYTSMYCVNFLSEQGQQFNLDAPPAVDPATVRHLTGILNLLLARIA